MIEAFGSDEGMTAQQIREKYFYVQNVPYPSWSWENVKDKIHYRLTDEAFQLELKTVVDSVS